MKGDFLVAQMVESACNTRDLGCSSSSYDSHCYDRQCHFPAQHLPMAPISCRIKDEELTVPM